MPQPPLTNSSATSTLHQSIIRTPRRTNHRQKLPSIFPENPASSPLCVSVARAWDKRKPPRIDTHILHARRATAIRAGEGVEARGNICSTPAGGGPIKGALKRRKSERGTDPQRRRKIRLVAEPELPGWCIQLGPSLCLLRAFREKRADGAGEGESAGSAVF